MRYAFLIILMTGHLLFGQNSDFEIKGKVIDSETSEHLIGAIITVLERPEQTFTDIEGNFRLTINNTDKKIIKVSFSSYKSSFIILKDTLLNDMIIKLKSNPVWMSGPDIFNYSRDSLSTLGRLNAEEDIQKDICKLLQKDPVTEVQDYYSKLYSFSFVLDTVNYSEYRITYNEIVIKNLSANKGNKVIEVLKMIDWENK